MVEWDKKLNSERPTPAVSPSGERGFLRFVKDGAQFFWKGVEITSEIAAGIIGFTKQIISNPPKEK